MTITAYGPDGLEAASAFVSEGDGTSGTEGVQLCGSLDEPGRYSIEASGEWSDYDAEVYDQPFTLPAAAFTMRRPKTKTSLKVKSLPRGRMRLTVTVKDERPNGYFPTEYADVKLQARVNGRWVTANQGKGFTDENGVETYLHRRTTRGKARAVMVDDSYQRSVSTVVVVPGR